MFIYNLAYSRVMRIYNMLNTFLVSYPKITSKSSLCSYYRKNNKLVPVAFYFFSTCFIMFQVCTFPILLFTSTPLSDYKFVVIGWLMIDIPCIAMSEYCLRLKEIAISKENKENMSQQIKVNNKLALCAIIPSVFFGLLPLTFGHMTLAESVLNINWAVFFFIQVQFNSWIANGVLYKTFLISVFNITFCLSCLYKGYFKDYIAIRIVLPVLIACATCLVNDREIKENFILKKIVKEQKAVYQKFFEMMHDPVVILDSAGILLINEASRNILKVNKENFMEKANFIVSEKGDPLSNSISSALSDSSPEKEEIRNKKFYLHDENSPIITYNAILKVTLFTATYMSRKKTVSIIMRDITGDLKQEQQKIEAKYKNMLFFSISHELRTPLNILQGFLNYANKMELQKRS